MTIHNTASDHPLVKLLVASGPGGIERQEAAGQADLTSSFRELPIDGMEHFGEALKALGFTFDDGWRTSSDIFAPVTAPAGWSLKPTEHSMWSSIVDDQGRTRGMVFYKAAFYDRSAHFYLQRRYVVDGDYDTDPKPRDQWRVRVTIKDRATGQNVAECPWHGYSDYAQDDIDKETMKANLAETYPNYEDVLAYW